MGEDNSLLLSVLQRCQGATLMVADENCLDFPFASMAGATTVISNRFDVAHQAREGGLDCHFCDYRFDWLAPASMDNLVYRISKEKPVVHHIANQAATVLKEGGQLWLIGAKQEGIKTYAKTLAKRLGGSAQLSKEGSLYLVIILKKATVGAPLDDRDYSRLREIFTLDDTPVVSKPGLFGWNKIDAGSELLVASLNTVLRDTPLPEGSRLLDLGCGYGYLSLMANRLGKLHITATDNCAAAILACEENFRLHNVSGRVVADDCAASLTERFDRIICNPPFHQGFQHERKLTDKFLGTTRRLLARNGSALFVVNQFVPLETLAQGYFRTIVNRESTGGFKVIELSA